MADSIKCRWPWACIFWDVVPNQHYISLSGARALDYSRLNDEWYKYFQEIEDSILALESYQRPWEFITLQGYLRMAMLTREYPLLIQYCKLAEVKGKIIITGHRQCSDMIDIARYDWALRKFDRHKKCKDIFRRLPTPIAQEILHYICWF